MTEVNSLSDLVLCSTEQGVPISDIVKYNEMERSESPLDAIEDKMAGQIQVMRNAFEDGLNHPKTSLGGLIGGEGALMEEYLTQNKTLSGAIGAKAIARALATTEVNASMGKIVAAPTAGSCGILPGVLLTVYDEWKESLALTEKDLNNAFFTASGIGMVISERATVSGAEGGCQAECGVAAAMAAGGTVELCGGSPKMVVEAVAMSLKGILGLVCDPVAGLVEVPCAKRNALSVPMALGAVDMALAGIKSVIPADEVVDVMYHIGQTMSPALRETAEGGLAISPTGLAIKSRLDEGS